MKSRVWDGAGAPSSRKVLEHFSVGTEGLTLTLAREDIGSPTDWRIDAPHHTFVVHLAGDLRRMESVFGEGPSSAVLPAVGDVWVIPARSAYAALAEGGHVRFAEFKVPVGIGRRDTLAPRVAHVDPFLHHATEKAAALAARDDDAAAMALEWLLTTLRFHIADVYLGGPGEQVAAAAPDLRPFSARQTRLLADFVQARMSGAIKVDDLAVAAGLSMPRLLEGFKASFGSTPWRYVMRARMAEAKRLLETGTLSATAISVATGFSNPSHFAAVFSRHHGVSPTGHRDRTRGLRRQPLGVDEPLS